MTETLTRTEQVEEVLKAGGRVFLRADRGVVDLYDAHHQLVPAWQQAVQGAVKRLGVRVYPSALRSPLEWIETARDDLLRMDLVDAGDSLRMASAEIGDLTNAEG